MSRSSFSDDSGSEEASLADRILAKFEQSKFDNTFKDFLPEGCIGDLITEEAVLEELPALNSETPDGKELLGFIQKDARKVFAIAVHSGLTGAELCDAMKLFKCNNFHDGCLPIKDIRSNKQNLNLFRRKPWNKTRVYNFYEKQWKFLAPVFSKNKFKHDLPPESILPFIWMSSTVKEGTFSQIFQVKIHESHHKDPVITVRA